MADIAEKLRKLPEFKALQGVYAALLPLKPEGRRKVIEAIHALLTISAGNSDPSRDKGGKASKTRSRRK